MGWFLFFATGLLPTPCWSHAQYKYQGRKLKKESKLAGTGLGWEIDSPSRIFHHVNYQGRRVNLAGVLC